MARESILLTAWRLNRRIPILIVGLILLNIAAYVVMSNVVAPRLDALERRYIERQSQVREVRLTGQTGAAAGSPREIYRRGVEDLGQFRTAIPPRTEFTALIGEIFSLAGKAGLSIDRIGYDPKEVAGQGLLRYTLDFSVSGDYGQIKRFVYSLEQSDRLIAIEELSLSGGEGKSKEGDVNLRVRLTTYFKTDIP
ncbi:type 4a pilus biogenesis protein PilO [Desulfuromonas sp. TF]|jgi:type IV pilus assembly protein PilO|uniref:type 4a pilus biogenesis protein PilO n=1 Tax=Desulfuromonas sp. TF TaxID=1232410 RepID=UPI000427E694|nr:type 4a pilus biogenesis protein PilO [Desulfuromonas sp. TF]